MDIAQIQRINTMAKDLLDKGIADSMGEAIRIAENICSKSSDAAVLPNGSGPAGATPVAPADELPMPPPVIAEIPKAYPNPYAAPDDVDTQLRTLNFRLNEQAKHIAQLQQHIGELNSKLSTMHAQAAARPHSRVITPAPTGQTQLTVRAPEEPQRMVTLIDASTGESVSVAEASDGNNDSTGKRLHARVGAYTPADVSVEKMFYCGGK